MDGNESNQRGRGRGRAGFPPRRSKVGSGRIPSTLLTSARTASSTGYRVNAGNVASRAHNPQHVRIDRELNRPKGFGYRRLDSLSKLPDLQIMELLSHQKTMDEFIALANQTDLKDDFIVLIVLILGKLARIEFDEIMVQLLHQISSTCFLNQVLCYIVRSQDEEPKEAECQKVLDFYNSFVTFCHTVTKLLPTLASEKLPPLLKQCHLFLMSIHFDGIDKVKEMVTNVMERLKMEKEKRKAKPVKKTSKEELLEFSTPPNCFRDLSTVPMTSDLLQDHSVFLRPNIVQGAYRGVEHYLDVHFRLLREDFFRPLRDGIKEYVFKKQEAASTSMIKRRIKVNNLKMYTDAVFEEANVVEDKVGFLVCFDPKGKFCSSINWDQSKRFMLGSLLIFTRDDFETILLAKVLKRNVTDLEKGRLLIELLTEINEINLFNETWLMAESNLFFGAYSYVLEALKRFDEVSFPLTDYIVQGKSEPQTPSYLLRATNPLYSLPLEQKVNDDPLAGTLDGDLSNLFKTKRVRIDVHPLDNESWPAAIDLGLDESQYEAFKGALTKKVMLIQGPPGTGKTYLGLRIASVLLENYNYWSQPLVVVCYTNHALDQFLTGLMPFTNSIVRVGGGSKDKRLEQFSMQNLKRNYHPGRTLSGMVSEFKRAFSDLKDVYCLIGKSKAEIQSNCGIVDPECFLTYGVITKTDLNSFESRNDFIEWLEGGFHMKNLHCQLGQNLDRLISAEHGDKALFLTICFSKLEDVQRKSKGLEAQYYAEKQSYLQHQLMSPLTKPELLNVDKIKKIRCLKQLKVQARWQVYRFWVEKLISVLCQAEVDFQPQLMKAAFNLKQARMVEEQDLMASCKVVGMTTTCAATRQSILKQLRPRIVIVEEAAEILEAHVVVSLTKSVEHLIMIGDHLQLKPNSAVIQLATKFHLNVSLFERLINNNVECVSLTTQHRMRPEIAKLVCPAIYPLLINHESVLEYPSIKGVSCNMAFIDHRHLQEEVEEIQSFRNVHEAKFISAMVRYLCLQGYQAQQITVLATYKGQMFYLNKLRQDNPFLSNVRITVVDNYQGEENDIILLSLVRSNESGDVGFLKIENRVCVALSRAKHGLYIFGNMQNLLTKGEIWPKISKELCAQNSLVEALELRCELHRTLTRVTCADDFKSVPEGGCLRQCGTLMGCGHICPQVCHANDREHQNFKCFEPCERPACEKNHKCPQLCHESCKPCMVLSTVSLLCKHIAEVPCHVKPSEYKCLEVVACTLVPCNHQRDVLCYQSKKPEEIKCVEPCEVRLDCGHSCENKCHLTVDPDHEEYKCYKPCGRNNAGCTGEHYCKKSCHMDCEMCTIMVEKLLPCKHKWTMKCHEEPSRKLCGDKCRTVNECGHRCKKKCRDECDPCLSEVEKIIPACQHKQKMHCGKDPSTFDRCGSKCDRTLPCGHSCTNLCHEECVSKCLEKVPYPSKTVCGHTIHVPCHKKYALGPDSSELLELCEEPCNVLLQPCNHRCKGSCGRCWQGRLHHPCQEACGRVLVCGHSCKAPCAEKCPPCNAPCSVKCEHSQCPRKCGAPCAPCKEPCLRKCSHQKCSKKCGQRCSVAACKERCQKTLKQCKHKCVGLCGDICICEECNPHIRNVLFGSEDEEEARFIILPDCKHIFEVSGLKKWLQQDTEIKEKVCPSCCTPIRTCLRFHELIMGHAFDVQAVKLKVFGHKSQIVSTTAEALENLEHSVFTNDLNECYKLLALVKSKLNASGNQMRKWKKSWYTPALSFTEASNLLQYSKVLSNLFSMTMKYLVSPHSSYRPPHAKNTKKYDFTNRHTLNDKSRCEVIRCLQTFAKNLASRNVVRLSDQEAKDISGVIKWLEILVILCSIESSPNFSLLSSTSAKICIDLSKKVRGAPPYSDYEKDRVVLTSVAKEVACIISKSEINIIVSAMRMTKGHWFKCPNGHYYAIGDCGGATIESKCNECGATIGGGSHRLRRDNAFAPEIDGATVPAWPGSLH